MAANIPEILARLNAKVGVLTERYGVVKRQRDEAISECEQLRRSLEDMTAKLEQAQIQIEYLRISHKVAPTPDDVRQSQALITELVKKIDKCISQLRND